MKQTNRIEYLSLIKYALAFIGFILFNSVTGEESFLSLPLLIALLFNGCSLFITPLLCVCSVLLTAKNLLLNITVSSAFITLVFSIYRLTKSQIRYELILYSVFSCMPFVFMPSGEVIIKNIIISGVSVLLTGVVTVAIKSVGEKGLKYKLSFEETSCIALTVITIGLGVNNLFGYGVWKSITIFLILITTFVYRLGVSGLIAGVLSLPTAIYYADFSFVGFYFTLSLISVAISGISRHLAGVSVAVTDYALTTFFSGYGYTLTDLIYPLIACVVFSLISTKWLTELKEKLYSFRERQLVRQTINRNRYMLSNRLYEISEVFLEIGNVFSSVKADAPTETAVIKMLSNELYSNACSNCDNKKKCAERGCPDVESLSKLFGIGLAKGRISFIDLPTPITDRCVHANNLIFCANRQLADYRNKIIENLNLDQSKELIGNQAHGVAEILKGLALETGQTLKYQSRIERNLADLLHKKGITVSELLIYGDSDNVSVSMILAVPEIPLTVITRCVSQVIGSEMLLYEKAKVNQEKTFLIFKKAPEYDAVFGIATAKKDGSTQSGDTHSVTRLKGDKFLVALSDGMGSGEKARKISDAGLTLIESFYKAGMSSKLILDTANKVLVVNTEDAYTALDVGIIDLKTLNADFIKFGAPYGFILCEEGIKVIEGNSLPLGILNELSPVVNQTTLNNGDTILFVSDGVSDAFKSSSNFIDFLRTRTAKNPQTFCNEILTQAITLSNGKPDDMTCLAVRVFKKPQQLA